MFSEDTILTFLLQYAYMPYLVYGFVILFMLMSGFGFPIPEEVVLVSCGLIGYMSLNPHLFPPPDATSQSVDVHVLAAVCLFAVLLSDSVVYWLGKHHGVKVFYVVAKIRYFFMTSSRKSETTIDAIYQRYVNSPTFNKINILFQNHGSLAVGIFRFTPGIRFPGHLSCGMMGVSVWKFLLVDSIVALISVPTQVLIVAYYGEVILHKFREFKMAILGVAFITIVFYIYKKYKKTKSTSEETI